MADPATLARIGDRVSARLRANPLVEERGDSRVQLFLWPSFLTSEECEQLISVIESRIRPSPLFTERDTTGIRTSSTHFFAADAPDAVALGRKIDDALGMDRACAEGLQGQRYCEGDEYRHHRDYFREERAHWQTQRQRGGQRSWTAMVYLNAVEAGGETSFSSLGLSIDPQPGMLVTWNNMNAKGRPNPDTKHASLPVQAGRKYVITQWYRQEKRTRPAG